VKKGGVEEKGGGRGGVGEKKKKHAAENVRRMQKWGSDEGGET